MVFCGYEHGFLHFVSINNPSPSTHISLSPPYNTSPLPLPRRKGGGGALFYLPHTQNRNLTHCLLTLIWRNLSTSLGFGWLQPDPDWPGIISRCVRMMNCASGCCKPRSSTSEHRQLGVCYKLYISFLTYIPTHTIFVYV